MTETALAERSETLPVKADPPTINIAAMFERLAANPEIPVDKLQALMDMQRAVMADQAKATFARDFAAMQADLPVITERGKTNNGRYATLEDIVETVRPILTRHGFSLSHRTEWPDGAHAVRIVGVLTHRDGHERTSEFLTQADTSGSKNNVQGWGSAMSYGRRYTTLDLLNIVTREEDNDGATASAPPPPDGYEQWGDDIRSAADNGMAAFEAAWKESKPAFRTYLAKRNPRAYAKLRQVAEKAGA